MEHDLIGKQIGPYQLLDRLGAGGMASVYRAHDPAHDRDVAIKILPIHLAANETVLHRFMREAKTVTRLQHAHILPVYDFGDDGGTPYIVMKYIDGGTLDLIIKRGPLPLVTAARILAQVARGLDYAHSHNIIHRDIKPENILFDKNGQVYLGDFGVARLREASEHLTGTGGFVGTASYASPEQCRGEELNFASDIYSLGVVLYEMLTGQLPFTGPTPLAIMHQHISEPPPNPLKHRSDLPLGIADVMRKALAKLPTVRYQTADALSAALVNVLKKELGTKPFADPAPPIGPNPTFDRPSSSALPPMPTELLRALPASEPVLTIRTLPPRPVEPVDSHLSRRHQSYLLFGVLLTLFMLALIVLLIVVRG